MAGRPNPIRQRIREALNSMPTVASTELLARQAIDSMSENERYHALLALLPRLIREEDRRRSQGGIYVDEESAWVGATERRVRVDGEDMFLADADAEQVRKLAEIRERSAGNIGVSAERFHALADTMQRHEVDTVAGVPAVDGLSALRLRLRGVRQRVASRNALFRLQTLTSEMDESLDLSAAREALAAAQRRAEAASAAAELHARQLQTLRDGSPASLHPVIDRTINRIAS